MKKVLSAIVIFSCVFCLAGCGNNKEENKVDTTNSNQQEEAYTLTTFENDIKELIPTMEKTDTYYQMVGANAGYKIYSDAEYTYRLEIYQYDKSGETYAKAEADQKITMDNIGSYDAIVKNGYALLIDSDFPEYDKVMELFNKLN